jgi:hypothetical protein
LSAKQQFEFSQRQSMFPSESVAAFFEPSVEKMSFLFTERTTELLGSS